MKRGDDGGFGLLLVVVVLALLGLLSLSAFGIARREFRSAHDLGYAGEAFEAAESGLAVAAAAAGGVVAPLLVPQVGPGLAGSRTRFATTILRLNGSLILLQSTGERLDGAGEVLARRRLGLLGKLELSADSTPSRFQALGARSWVQMY